MGGVAPAALRRLSRRFDETQPGAATRRDVDALAESIVVVDGDSEAIAEIAVCAARSEGLE